MKIEVFRELLNRINQQEQKVNLTYKAGVDLINFYDDGSAAISLLLSVYYGEEGKEWIYWYLYDRDDKNPLSATDKDGNAICYDVESLWKEVEECRINNKTEYELPYKMTDEETLEILKQLYV